MRDINRIDEYCERLAQAWKKVPDWRLSQIFCNLQREMGWDGYYMEDEDFFNELEQFLNQYE